MTRVVENNHTGATALNVEFHNGMSLDSTIHVGNSEWIIDSGSTDHMTFDAKNTTSLTYTSQKFVTTANGTPTPVMGEGTSNVTEKLNLNSVLVVPSLYHNLLLVSQITTNLNCVVNLLA